MSTEHQQKPVVVGIIANPISARDIRRVVTNASNIQTSERVNIILRLLATLSSCGVNEVMMMPDRSGICSNLLKNLDRASKLGQSMPALNLVDIDVTSTVNDTLHATRIMQEAAVNAIVVLGGDGTHRAVISQLIRGCRRGLPEIPIAGLSTGTNNAFPEMREPTITAMAVALYATGKLNAEQAINPNKILEISINQGERGDIAIVDVLISPERFIGARAIWKSSSLHSLYLTFADPQCVGFSAIGGLLQPTSRSHEAGLRIRLSGDNAARKIMLQAPIAPGYLTDVGITDCESMPADKPFSVELPAGVLALDGERELTFSENEAVSITLRKNAFKTIDITRCMHTAAADGLFHQTSDNH